jgi:hypothetical protein
VLTKKQSYFFVRLYTLYTVFFGAPKTRREDLFSCFLRNFVMQSIVLCVSVFHLPQKTSPHISSTKTLEDSREMKRNKNNNNARYLIFSMIIKFSFLLLLLLMLLLLLCSVPFSFSSSSSSSSSNIIHLQ